MCWYEAHNEMGVRNQFRGRHSLVVMMPDHDASYLSLIVGCAKNFNKMVKKILINGLCYVTMQYL